MERELRAIEPGTKVYSSDDETVGEIEEVGANYLLVRKGLFFVKERYVPFDAVSRVGADGVYLGVAKDQLDAMAWDAPPMESTSTRTASIDTVATDVPRAGLDRRTAVTERDQVDATIPVIEEELRVGKRAVEGGGVRVSTHMEEVPVNEQVTLRDETVTVERQAVNRAVTDADLASMHDETFELRETDEEAVVSKDARIVEEIVVKKSAQDRTETVSDSVRRTKVEVDQLSGQTTTGDMTTSGMTTSDATLDVSTSSTATDEGAIERGASKAGNAVERATGADLDRDGDVGRRDPRNNV